MRVCCGEVEGINHQVFRFLAGGSLVRFFIQTAANKSRAAGVIKCTVSGGKHSILVSAWCKSLQKWTRQRRIAWLSYLSNCSEFLFILSASLSHITPLFPLLSPSFTLFLSFTPYVPWWLTCVSVMSLTPSLLLCLTAPFRSALEPETMWRSPPHTLLHIFPSCISCAALVFTPLVALFSPFFFFYISCRSVVALGESMFCWSVTSSPLRLTRLSSAVCFSPWLWQTHYLCRTAVCVRQQWLATFHSNIVKERQFDIWRMKIRHSLIFPGKTVS